MSGKAGEQGGGARAGCDGRSEPAGRPLRAHSKRADKSFLFASRRGSRTPAARGRFLGKFWRRVVAVLSCRRPVVARSTVMGDAVVVVRRDIFFSSHRAAALELNRLGYGNW